MNFQSQINVVWAYLKFLGLFGVLSVGGIAYTQQSEGGLSVGFFEVDVTPPVGSPLAYDLMTWVDQPLSARGVVILGGARPVVLCSVDWIGIGNGGHEAWKEALAEAAGTRPDHVAIHTVHQHDAPVCDFSAYRLLSDAGLADEFMDPAFMRSAIAQCALAVQKANRNPVQVTHIGVGASEVSEVASNRRIPGADGRVQATRWTATTDPALRDAPVGIIDPLVRLISFWNEEKPLGVLSFYATHPQSYYRTGGANPDFPGMARTFRQTQLNGLPSIHFNGAGGNIGAGKWNDGSPGNRIQLAIKLARGMEMAWKLTEKSPVSASSLSWLVQTTQIPPREEADMEEFRKTLNSPDAPIAARKEAAAYVAWLSRLAPGSAGISCEISRLRLGHAHIVFLPGEPVVEYQLMASAMRPDQFIAVAGYGDYGPGYICLGAHYDEGGYESSIRASRVSRHFEPQLRQVLENLILDSPQH